MQQNTQQQQPLIVNKTQAAQILGVTTRTLHNWEQRKLVNRLPDFASPRYSRAHLEALAANQPVVAA